MIDSGAALNIINSAVVEKYQIPVQPCIPPIKIKTIDDALIGDGITHQMKTLTLKVGLLHHKSITFYVVDFPKHEAILGFPWLSIHNTDISWYHGELTHWSTFCQENCFSVKPQPCYTKTVESPITHKTVTFPSCYNDLLEVFSKTKATQLPPHCPWDCAIDLLPNAMPPKSKVYPLSQKETQAMDEYINEGLDSGFFFVEKKDGGLRPCIDYRGLNNVTVKFCYPLPLVPSALEQLREATIYTKLDLRSAYNLIRIYEGDEWKTTFLTTRGHYEYRVMPYGMANSPAVFQSFINEIFKDLLNKFVIAYIDNILVYSETKEEHVDHVRTVLSRLLQNQLYVKAEKYEFHVHQTSFLGYHISHQGVKMDSSKIQAVTEWPQPTTVKELQCFLGFANFYRRFIHNYSMVAAPLTSLLKGKPSKLAWTEMASQGFASLKERFTSAPILKHPDPNLPFIVEVDASDCGIGAVLSLRHVTYRPGSKNSKADALSRRHDPRLEQQPPKPILPPTVILAPISWDIMEEIQHEQQRKPPPTTVPQTSTLYLATYGISKTPKELPSGLLQPLPIPQRPWSHLSIDFITDLPPSNEFTTILVTIDRFSKSCHLIPLKGLPSAMETALALFHNVFRIYGLPENIVSDRGTRFTSQVWRAFCKQLDISVSLTSGYHPQANGQVERLTQEIGRYLRTYCNREQHRWSEFLPWAEYTQNSLTCSFCCFYFQFLFGTT
ncbi:Transposon Tf2-8 polyprotein [Labeo rohita]|uniref:ribonuclease H n=1 Tax=Labeo rohita TaxID=84645 RepID=A0ABQ8L258_LABRO|nr:Transposon Tf2-8 polyprotein [Labeo rohita]